MCFAFSLMTSWMISWRTLTWVSLDIRSGEAVDRSGVVLRVLDGVLLASLGFWIGHGLP